MASSQHDIGFRDADWVADQLGIDKNTVYRYLNAGRIPGLQLGKKWLVDEASLRDWLLREQRLQTEQRQVDHWLESDLGAQAFARGTATVMFTDMMGATDYLERAGEEALTSLVRSHNRILRDALPREGCSAPKYLGDGALVLFERAEDAVESAIEVQRSYTAGRPQETGAPALQVGLHTGEVTRGGDDFGGKSIFVAARITQLASAAEILVSSTTVAALPAEHAYALGAPRDVSLESLSGTFTVQRLEWRPAALS